MDISAVYLSFQVLIKYLSSFKGPLQISQGVSGSTTPASSPAAITTTFKIDPGSKVLLMTGFLKRESLYKP
ncbi:MAG: hypothetical protein ACD_13C00144G0071 [uncultured bacterium]|nr:MAG: hypothetical protein ACD_13C00144G0071 [uncultured bacterium]